MANRLTTDIDASVECLGDLRVHLYEQLLLLGDLFVAQSDFFLHPITERLSNDCVDHVDEPLTWDFVHVTIVREVVRDLWVLPGSLE